MLPAFDLGLTDLNKTEASNSDKGAAFDVPGFVQRISSASPAWWYSTEWGVARAYATAEGHSDPRYGFQDWTVGESVVFVVPNSSANNYDDASLMAGALWSGGSPPENTLLQPGWCAGPSDKTTLDSELSFTVSRPPIYSKHVSAE